MRPLFKCPVLAAAVAFAWIAAAGIATAQDVAKVVKERQDQMRQQARSWKAIKDYVDGKGDQTAAIAGADDLTRLVPKVPELFPPGTGAASPEGKYRPTPQVWSQWDKFLVANKTVVEQVGALDAVVKGGDKEQIATALAKLNFCSACHDDFRETIKP